MIDFCKEKGFFNIQTPNTCYIIRIFPDGTAAHVYYGARLNGDDMSYYHLFRERAFSPMCKIGGHISSPDCILQEYPTACRGDYRTPALEIEGRDGRRDCELKYSNYRIVKGKPEIPQLPQLGADFNEAETLELVLEDSTAEIKVILSFTAFSDMDIIARHTEIINTGNNEIKLKNAASMNLDLWLCGDYEFIDLYGAWAREHAAERVPLHHGVTVCESRRGSTGHQQNPFAALVSPGTDENSGEVYAAALVYSADFRITAERDQFDGVRLQAGINPATFTWLLEPGKSFVTPEALLTFSNSGLSGMSHTFHTAVRRHLGRSAYLKAKRQIVINCWEAMYYDFNAEKIRKFAKKCRGLGIDTFVLDDGWFGKRDDDRSSLGDWFVNKEKLPGGLEELIDICKKAGMKFGLWFEPEMISEDSDLFREHPDWCIHTVGRKPLKSRYQYVLDYSRPEIADAIYTRISKILKENDISYVKWDMNRNITDNGSDYLSPDRQGEHTHRYILGVYSLMKRLTDEFPNVLFEGCSGGGGRFDLGMLYYMPQIWTSDNTDAVARLEIQYGNSLVFPLSSMSAHISACPNHQTGRITPFKTRSDVAQLCNFGYELDPAKLNDEEFKEIAEQIKLHRRLEPLVEKGTLYRLISPFGGNTFAWEAASPDKSFACAVFVRKLAVPNDPGYILKLKGLDPDKKYTVEQLGLNLSGAALMNAGIPIVELGGDSISMLFTVKEI